MSDAAAGADAALCAFPVPDQCTLNYLRGEAHFLPGSPVDVQDVGFVGLSGWLLPVEEDSNSQLGDMDVLWDELVPKEDGVQDIDTAVGSDSDAAVEIGSVNLNQVMDNEVLGPERVFLWEKMVSMATEQFGFVPGTPDTFYPTTMTKVSIGRKKYRAMLNSGLVFGMSSPDLLGGVSNDVVPSITGALTTSLHVLRYLSSFLEKAVIDFLSITETGAETPYEDLLDFVADVLEKIQSLSGVGAFTTQTWTGAMRCTAGIAVPGKFGVETLGPSMEAR